MLSFLPLARMTFSPTSTAFWMAFSFAVIPPVPCFDIVGEIILKRSSFQFSTMETSVEFLEFGSPL